MVFDPDRSAVYMSALEKRKHAQVDRAIRNRRDNERRQQGDVDTELSPGMPRGWLARTLAQAATVESPSEEEPT